MSNKPLTLQLSEIRQELNFNRSSSELYKHISIDLLLLTASGLALLSGEVILYIFSQVGLVAFFFRSFGLMHECVHGNLSDSKSVNSQLGIIYGAFCFLPFLNWKKIHLEHHLWAGNIDKDPTMQLVKSIPVTGKKNLTLLNFFWLFWIPFLAVLQHIVFWKESIRVLRESKNRTNYALSLLPPLIIIALSIGTVMAGPFIGVLPAVFAYMLLVEIVNFPHHLNLPYRTGKERLSYLEQYKVSRSCHYNPILGEYIFMNFNYHTEHHLYPNLPWHQLPKASELVQEILGNERYNYDKGHDWIVRARKKELPIVLEKAQSFEEAA